jgi:hypothetical protein
MILAALTRMEQSKDADALKADLPAVPLGRVVHAESEETQPLSLPSVPARGGGNNNDDNSSPPPAEAILAG